MAYVMNRVGGEAFGHLEPRLRKSATKPWVTADEMLDYLKRIFDNSQRRENAKNAFDILRQRDKDFNTLWAEFRRLSIELDRNEQTLISDLTFILSSKRLLQMNRGGASVPQILWIMPSDVNVCTKG